MSLACQEIAAIHGGDTQSMLASMDSNVDGEISVQEWDSWWQELGRSQGEEKGDFMLAYFERCLDKFDDLGMGIPALPTSTPEPEVLSNQLNRGELRVAWPSDCERKPWRNRL